MVIIPPDFQRDIDGAGQAHIQVLTDGALAMQATVSHWRTSPRFPPGTRWTLLERRAARLGSTPIRGPTLDERLRVKFNPNMLSSWFAALLELLNMCTMVSLLLTAANVVREKERGTVERLLVSPARPVGDFPRADHPDRSCSFLILSASVSCSCSSPVFDLPIRGSLLLFFSVTALYVFAMTSMGIAIALVARNMAQAVLIMILILQPMIFLSRCVESAGGDEPVDARDQSVVTAALLHRLRVRGDSEGQWAADIDLEIIGWHRSSGYCALHVLPLVVLNGASE